MPFVATGAEFAANTVNFSTSDGNVATDYRGLAARAYIVAVHATSDTSPTRDLLRDVKITSTKDTTGVTIDLLEDGPKTGRFLGSFGFKDFNAGASEPATGHPFLGRVTGDARIQIDPAATTNTITVNAPGPGTKTISWLATNNLAAKVFDAAGNDITNVNAAQTAAFGYTGTLVFQVTDKDLNTDATKVESYGNILRVTSTSDPIGEFISIQETGITTNIFQGTLTFEATHFATNGKLFVRNGDTLNAFITDTTNQQGAEEIKPFPTGSGSWAFRTVADGSISLDRAAPSTYFGTSRSDFPLADDRARITVFDPDRDTGARQDSLTVSADSSGSTSPVTVTLLEIPSSPGFFHGVVGFTTGANGNIDGMPTLKMGIGAAGRMTDTLTVTYVDEANTGSNQGVNRQASAPWRETTDAMVTLGADPFVPLAGLDKPQSVQVSDWDSNRNNDLAETLTVLAKSTSDPSSLPLILTETGPDSGLFGATLRFTTGATGNGRLRVANGDYVSVSYADPMGTGGIPILARSNAPPVTYGTPSVWRTAQTATVTLDASNYHLQGTVGAITTLANILVVDPDRNHPLQKDTVSATAVTLTTPARSVVVTLEEIGIDSGIFLGELQFQDSAGAAAGKLPVSTVGTTSFRVEYRDPLASDETERLVPSATSVFGVAAAGLAIQIETSETSIPFGAHFERANRLFKTTAVDLSVIAAAYGSATAPVGTITMSSNRCTTPISASLSASGDRRGAATFTVREIAAGGGQAACPAGVVGVTLPDTLTIRSDTQTFTASIEVLPATTASILESDFNTAMATGRGLNGVAYVRLQGGAANADTAARDLARVVLAPQKNSAQTTTVYLVEDAVNSGIFTGSFEFSTTEASQGARNTGRLALVEAVPVRRANLNLVGEDSNPADFGGSIFDILQVQTVSGSMLDGLVWFPASDAVLTSATVTSWGSTAAYTLTLTGDDALGGRATKSFTASGNPVVTTYSPDAPFIAGSELVYSTDSKTENPTPVAAGQSFVVTLPSVAGQAAEYIVDKNRDGAIICADIDSNNPAADLTIDGTRTTSGLLGSPGPAAVTCSANAATGEVTYSFTNSVGASSCSTGDGSTCSAVISYTYRAQAVKNGATSDGSSPPSENPTTKFRYKRSSTGFSSPSVTVGAATDGQVWIVESAPAHRTITVRSVDASGSVRETDSQALNFVNLAGGQSVFTGTALVELSPNAANGRVLVGPNPTSLEFAYPDPFTGFDGKAASAAQNHFRSQPVAANWKPSVDGLVEFMNPTFTGAAPDPFFGPCVPVRVTDADADLTPKVDTVSLTARNTGDASQTATITLVETGGATGVFTGVIPVAGCNNAGGIVFPSGGGILLAAYTDLHGATGATTVRDAVINWRPSANAVISLLRSSDSTTATPTNPIVGADGGLTVQIVDPDANVNSGSLDTVTARVTSTTNPTGMTITLTELSGSPGTFSFGPVRFREPGTTGPTRLEARYGDRILVSYDDTRDASGNAVTLVTNPGTKWMRAFDGAVLLDFDQYIGEALKTPANGLLAKASNPGQTALAQITVADGDCNMDPGVVERIPSAVPSSVCPALSDLKIGRLNSDGTIASGSQPTVTYLLETGANTGVFLAVVGFASGTSPVNENLGTNTYAKVPMGAGTPNTGRIGVTYRDPFLSSGSGSFTFRDDAPWFRAGYGIVKLDKTGYKQGSTANPVTVTVTVYDADFADAATAQTFKVRASSQADTGGIDVTMTETGVDTRVFTGTFNLIPGDSTALSLRVSSSDTLTVVYQDAAVGADAGGPRTATAPISGDSTPPITTLTPNPLLPNGQRGVYTSRPTISLSPSETGVTKFRIGATGPVQTYTTPFDLGEGSFTVRYWSIDQFENTEAERSRAFEVDLNNPTQVPQNVTATAVAGGKIQINWSAVPITADPFQFHEYSVYRDGSVNPIVNQSTANYPDAGVTDETAHTYRVAVKDKSGRQGNYSAQVSATPDKTLPTLANAVVNPTTFDVRAKPASISVSATASDAHLSTVRAGLRAPSGTILASVALTGSGGSFSGTIPLANVTQPCLCLVRVTARDMAGNERIVDVNYTITGPDTEAPSITFAPAGATVPLGTPVTVSVADNVGLTSVTYTLDNGAAVTVDLVGNLPTKTFDVPTTGLATGTTHTLSVSARDNARNLQGSLQPNEANATKTFTVGSSTTVPPPSNFFLTGVTAEPRGDGTVLVKWDVPQATLASGIGGYQVWRAASPFTLVGTVQDPEARTFVDRNANPGAIYRYAVSIFTTAPVDNITQVPGFTSESNVPATGEVAAQRAGLPNWFWGVLSAVAIIAVVLLVVIVLVARRGQSGGGQETVLVAQPAPGAEPEPILAEMDGEKHRLRCPECSHRFEVVGKKPIVTNCPNCGRKGILR